ncbi:MAG: heme exporter protein CcmD [Rhodospirillales bacterium]|jgi:heme exporter protein D
MMTDTNSILSMTEHGAYVWPTYGLAAVVLIGLVVLSLHALARSRAELENIELETARQRDEA